MTQAIAFLFRPSTYCLARPTKACKLHHACSTREKGTCCWGGGLPKEASSKSTSDVDRNRNMAAALRALADPVPSNHLGTQGGLRRCG